MWEKLGRFNHASNFVCFLRLHLTIFQFYEAVRHCQRSFNWYVNLTKNFLYIKKMTRQRKSNIWTPRNVYEMTIWFCLFLCSLLLQRISQTKYLFAHNIHTLWLLAILVEWNRNIPEVQITFPLHDKVKFAIFPLSCVLFYTLCTNIIHVVSSCIPWCQLFYPHVSMHFISTRHDITVYRVWQCRHEI